jgi:NADH-quinone oxidoreductase subunit K
MIPVTYYLYISVALFVIGMMTVLIRKNAIVILMGIELMLNAANINLVAFSKFDGVELDGQLFALFVIVIAAAEAAVALAIIVKAVRTFNTVNVDEFNKLKG